MRKIAKLEVPAVLEENAETWTAEYQADPKSNTKKYRYRHPEIKGTLLQETFHKCVYCESKIGHNTPGDVEHKTPSAVDRNLHFSWTNLTIACTECNRRKSDYFDPNLPFLDPYNDDVEDRVIHLGPVLGWHPGDTCAEVTIRLLALDTRERDQLIIRKVEAINTLNDLVGRIATESGVMQELLRVLLSKRKDCDSEFSGMICAVCAHYGV